MKMEKSKLSDAFSMCTLMMHDAVTDFYEDIHDSNGDAVDDVDDVIRKSSVLKSRVISEIQMIIDMTLEFTDSRG